MRTDRQIRSLLLKNDINPPKSDLHLIEIRYSAREGSWYVQSRDGVVYWHDSGSWKECPLMRSVGDV